MPYKTVVAWKTHAVCKSNLESDSVFDSHCRENGQSFRSQKWLKLV